MPSEHAPRVRVVLTVAQQRARVRGLAYGAIVGVALACVLVVVAIQADGWLAWLALVGALVPATVAVLAARTAMVLGKLQPPPATTSPQPRQPRERSGGTLPINLGRLEREAGRQGPPESSSAPSDPA